MVNWSDSSIMCIYWSDNLDDGSNSFDRECVQNSNSGWGYIGYNSPAFFIEATGHFVVNYYDVTVGAEDYFDYMAVVGSTGINSLCNSADHTGTSTTKTLAMFGTTLAMTDVSGTYTFSDVTADFALDSYAFSVSNYGTPPIEDIDCELMDISGAMAD